jgi:hypothetical protein
MSLNTTDIDRVFRAARAFAIKIRAATAIADETTFIPVMADFKGIAISLNDLAVLINRHFKEDEPHVHKTSSNKLSDIAES